MSTWACASCTFLNEAGHLACAICATARLPAAAAADGAAAFDVKHAASAASAAAAANPSAPPHPHDNPHDPPLAAVVHDAPPARAAPVPPVGPDRQAAASVEGQLVHAISTAGKHVLVVGVPGKGKRLHDSFKATTLCTWMVSSSLALFAAVKTKEDAMAKVELLVDADVVHPLGGKGVSSGM